MKARLWLSGRIVAAQAWSKRGTHFFIFAAAVLLAIALLWIAKVVALPGKVDDHLRWLAAAFETSGVLLVIAGIDKARVKFGRPSIFSSASTWLKDALFLLLTRPTTIRSAGVAMGGVSAMAVAGRVIAHGGSIPDQIAWLQRQVQELHERVDKAGSEIKAQEQRFRTDLNTEASARKEGDDLNSKQLEENMIGDYGVELLGAGFLIVGVILSNLTPELASVAHWLWAAATRAA